MSGEKRKAEGIPESFDIRYTGEENAGPGAELLFDGCVKGEKYYFSGKAPVLRIKGEKELNTFLSLTRDGETKIQEINGEIFEYVFDEGEYSYSVWNEDGWGVRYEAERDIDCFVYDNDPPVIIKLDVLPSGKGGFTENGKVYSRESVMICPEAVDSLSGTDQYIFRVKNRINGIEYEAYGDRLQLDPGFYGEVEVRATDMAGNISEAVKCPEIMIDNREPVLKNRVFKEDKKNSEAVTVYLEAEDSLSGLKDLTLILNDRILTEENCGGEKNGRVTKSIKLEKLKEGSNGLRLEAFDITGNKAVYEFELEKERKKEEESKEQEAADEAPEMYIRGFDNFEKTEKAVRIETGTIDPYPVAGKVSIERHDMEGQLTAVYEAEPGFIEVSDEGNYVVHYEIGNEGSVYEEYAYFTIDRSSPVIDSLKDVDKKSFRSFSIANDPLNSIEDYTYVDHRMTLSGREYDGRKISEPGKYILKISAVDELGHSSEETAEFLIVKENKKTVSEEKLPSEVKDRAFGVSSNKTSGNKILSENKAQENLVKPKGTGQEKTVYRNERTAVYIILAAGLMLCAAATVFLVIYPIMERNRYK